MCGAEVLDRERLAWRVLEGVMDPEIPVVSLVELGIVRAVRLHDEGTEVVVTPTYSGCPATELIEQQVCEALDAAGLGPVRLVRQRAPAWTTDWITPEGRRKLAAYGIAPPGPVGADEPVAVRIVRRQAVACPHCASADTERLSGFGATACKALYRCRACREPFEYFKPL